MKTSRVLPWLLLLSGMLVYCVGLWLACPLLNGKGYFLGVLMTGMFAQYVYLREEGRGHLDERFVSVCRMVALITFGLLLVGVINAPLSAVERLMYPAAFLSCLAGQFWLFRASRAKTV